MQISIRTGVVHGSVLRLALPRTATLPPADIAKEMRYKRPPLLAQQFAQRRQLRWASALDGQPSGSFGGNDLDQSANRLTADNFIVVWKPISTAPYVGDLEIAAIKKDGPHPVEFPCRRVVGGWIASETNNGLR